jgi:tetratricopeptide (TPR) repeat protein
MGGWTLEAVENVCGADGLQRKSVLDLLAKLVAKCLVVAEPTSQAHMRYRLLETLREYAWEQLVTSGESEPTLRRHARYFGQLAEEAEPALLGRGQVSILERLDQERDNMRTVLRWAVKRSEIDAGVRLTGALWRFWRIRGPLSEGLAWLDEFLGQTDPNGPPSPERAKALVGAAALSRILADLNLASDRFEEALAILRKLDDKKGIGFVLLGLGLIAISRRELGRAAEFLEQSVAVRRQVGDRPGLAFSLASLGNVVRRQGDLPRAKTLVEQSLALRRESGERQATGAALIVLAQIERQQGEPERARALLREGIGLFHEMGDTRGTAWAFAEQARLERETGDDESATQLYEVSLRLNRDCGDTVGLVACLNGLAALVAARGGFECAHGCSAQHPDSPNSAAFLLPMMPNPDVLSRPCVLVSADPSSRWPGRPDAAYPSSRQSPRRSTRPRPNNARRQRSIVCESHALTPRELEVLLLVTSGSSNLEIADN